MAFEADGDLSRALWTGKLQPEDVPPSEIARGRGPESGVVKLGMVADVFPEFGGPEVVVVHHLGAGSQCAIRVYDLDGHVRYQVWHDGALKSCAWLADARLLVFAGRNSEVYWNERGHPELKQDDPVVVFGIEPNSGVVRREFVKSSPGGGDLDPRWYKCVCPPRAQDVIWKYRLSPASGSESGRRVRFALDFRIDEERTAGITWDINEAGEFEPDSMVVGDAYNRNAGALPETNDFYLGPLPPITTPEGQ